ncbi:DNA repair protein RAD5 [Colletotrichum orbiculare MAFF 240422]|uniref:DNA repair protein RAD5 n=1 Tax=Colletotrichum orbiculare (strain 104-T / ATCC 96160 / CBS 514.97 / LARS 414 / MAFF 240422) TaxID=1213857 RepID=A0A484FBC6_COLOR|nr:DNA repair protein RAD5 [Colletotrichum orbiculare MAFF 240422]
MASPRSAFPRPEGDQQRKFQFSCASDDEDEEEAQVAQSSKDLTQTSTDLTSDFDAMFEATVHTSEGTDKQAQGKDISSCVYTQDEDLSDLFVPQNHDSAAEHVEIKVKDERESDEDIVMIHPETASKDAQSRWAQPKRWIIDLVTGVKEEPHSEAGVSREARNFQNESSASAAPGTLSDVKVKVEDEEKKRKRQNELTQKLIMKVALSNDEFAELNRLNKELEGLTGEGLSNEDREAGKQQKKARRSPPKTAKEYFARVMGKEQEKREARAFKRAAEGKSERQNKRQKLSVKETRQLEQGSKRLQSIREVHDAIQERADLGDLPDEPIIIAKTIRDQLKQIADNIPEGTDKALAKDQMAELREAVHAWGTGAVSAENGIWKVRGLKALLPSHQIIVGAWMLSRELKFSTTLPRGGILADVMGMGKTIETLSCMVGNQAEAEEKEMGEGATLVICQSGQNIDQWMAEIRKHCDKKFASDIVHYKASNKMDVELLGKLNVVFASYTQLRDSIPSDKERVEMFRQIEDPERFREWEEERTGKLFKMKWHRVVLDEAHMIKNHKSSTAQACCKLAAKYRWAVTGTPLVNCDSEFYSYLKFIQFDVGDLGDYLRRFCTGKDAKLRHQRLAFDIMYRRTQNDEFLGQRILNLRQTHPTLQHLMLSEEEMVIFRMTERCFRRRINKDLQDGVAERRILCYLTMLLRLRQASTHPFLLESLIGENFTLEDLRKTMERLRELKDKKTVYEQIGSWNQRHKISDDRIIQIVAEAERRKEADENDTTLDELLDNDDDEADNAAPKQAKKCSQPGTAANDCDNVSDDLDEVNSVDEIDEDDDGMIPGDYLADRQARQNAGRVTLPKIHAVTPLNPFGDSSFGLYFDMEKQLEYMERLEKLAVAKCGVCQKKPESPHTGSRCGHIFCCSCLVKHLGTKGRKCPRCPMLIGEPKPLRAFDSMDGIESDSHGAAGSPGSRKGKRGRRDKDYIKGFDYAGFQPTQDDKEDKKPLRFLQIADRMSHLSVTPSAKTTALKETILRWREEAPDDKIIIFSQFNVCMKVVARMLEGEGIMFSYLSGSMNTEQRGKAVKEFEKGDEVQVLIVSLRAGGTALNLTRGNRVILMELWWNHAVEQQAFARVYRMGQQKETHFLRFVVYTPIEQRMLKMQSDKILRIDAALQDNTPRAPKITVEDIASMLGKVVTRKGVMQVVADYKDGEDDDEDMEPDDETRAVAAEDEPDLEGFVVPDDEVDYEDDEDDEI